MTFDEIKRIALILFNEKGYEATTMRDISKQLDIAAPSIYHHFKSKEELFLALLKDSNELYINFIVDGIKENQDKTVETQIYEMFKAPIYFYKENRETFKFIVRSYIFPTTEINNKLSVDADAIASSHFKAMEGVFTKAFREKIIKEYSIKYLIQSFYALVLGYLFQIVKFNMKIEEENIRGIWDIYWNGIKK